MRGRPVASARFEHKYDGKSLGKQISLLLFCLYIFVTRLIYLCVTCALLYRVSQKNEPLFVKYFLGDYKLKIIEILYIVIQV